MDRYSKVKIIGHGTFGKVWMVQSNLSRHSYVLKEINLSFLSPADQEQALAESFFLSNMKHVNIIRYKDAFVDRNCLKIVMEYADGGDLHTAIFNQNGIPFTEHRILTWFIQICLALQYIHFKNIIHRDLKSQNIFLTRHKVVKIGDFGIAKFLERSDELAKTAIGTPYYLPPEIFQKKLYNNKSDIWALGCVLFEMTALEHAFKATDFFQLANLVLSGQRRNLPKNCSPIIQELVDQLLKFHPEERPSTMEILRNPALQPYLSEYMASQSSTENFNALLTGACKKTLILTRQPSGTDAKFGVNKFPNDRKTSPSSITIPKCTYVAKKEAEKPQSSCVTRASMRRKFQKPLNSDKGQKPKVEQGRARHQTYGFHVNETEKSDFLESCDTYVLPTFNLKPVAESKLSKSDDSLNKCYECICEPASQGLSKAKISDSGYSGSSYNNSCCNNQTKLVSADGDLTQSTSTSTSAAAAAAAATAEEDAVFGVGSIAHNCTRKTEISVGTHCFHSQCHQCMLDTLWKNRIRNSVGGTVNTNEYLRLKNKLVRVFRSDLFVNVYRSLTYDWDGKEGELSKNKFQEIMNSLNYEQVQSLPLMMQLIQLDLVMKLKK